MKICIYEDEKTVDFFPITMTRATFEIRSGKTLLLEKILDFLGNPKDVCLYVRDYLVPVVKLRYPNYKVNELNALRGDDVLFVNGRWLYMGEKLDVGKDEVLFNEENNIVMFKLGKENVERIVTGNFLENLKNIVNDLGKDTVKTTVYNWPWEPVLINKEVLEFDFKRLGKRGIYGKVYGDIEIVGEKEDLYIAPGAKVYPNVVIDTSEGPVMIDEGAKVYPFVFIEGPSSIGKKTYVMTGAKVREAFTAGPVCRVGGEVEESIMHGYSNKYHDGFLGHAYVGEWVNLGALTTNSDLKNDYSEVEVYINGRRVKTGSLKVGSLIGDHTKTSIGTLFNTGTVVGVMCNVLSTDLSPKYIPSFTWYYAGRFSIGSGLRRMLRTAERAMARRDKVLTDAERELFKYLYEMTREERETYIKRYSKK